MKTIPLTQGKFALVDDVDYEDVSKHKWFAVFDGSNWYAARKLNGNQVRLHNYLMEPPRGVQIDHRDGDGLNCQRRNMRISTHRQNMQNMKRSRSNKSGFKGVSWRANLSKWIAQARYKGEVKYLGLFKNVEDAARAYDTFTAKHYGQFALTNKMLGLLKFSDQSVPDPAVVLEEK